MFVNGLVPCLQPRTFWYCG